MNDDFITINIFKFQNDLLSLLSYYNNLPIGAIYLTLKQTFAEVQMNYKRTVVEGLQKEEQNKEENNSNSQD